MFSQLYIYRYYAFAQIYNTCCRYTCIYISYNRLHYINLILYVHFIFEYLTLFLFQVKLNLVNFGIKPERTEDFVYMVPSCLDLSLQAHSHHCETGANANILYVHTEIEGFICNARSITHINISVFMFYLFIYIVIYFFLFAFSADKISLSLPRYHSLSLSLFICMCAAHLENLLYAVVGRQISTIRLLKH